jgi:hypothetical protein
MVKGKWNFAHLSTAEGDLLWGICSASYARNSYILSLFYPVCVWGGGSSFTLSKLPLQVKIYKEEVQLEKSIFQFGVF